MAGPIELRDQRILIDGRPRLVMAGEVHYFRLRREEWPDRLAKLAAAGCNTVASYIPWLWHELPDGSFDLDGRTRPERDLGAFVDLCRDNGLWFFARPGPFVMAELKNEGLPYRLYDQHPEIVPVGWDGAPAPSRAADYLAPAFLAETRRWYAAVMPILAPRLYPNGGNIVAVQLDNEVGMLAWVTNSPDLTDLLLADLGAWLRHRYGDGALAARYPFDWANPAARAVGVRSPAEAYALPLLRDLGHYMRDRFARYVAALRGLAEESGITDIPLDLEFVRDGFARLGAVPALAHGCPEGGIVLTSTVSPGNARLLHLLNLDGFAKTLHPTEHGRPLFGGRPLALRPKEAVMLPLGVRVGPVRIVYATAEVAAVAADAVTFRLTQPEDVIVLETDRPLAEDDDYALTRAGRRTTVTARRPARGWSDADDLLSLRFV